MSKKNALQDLLSSLNAVISTNGSTQLITGHVIYKPAYTYKFQLKTTNDIGKNFPRCDIEVVDCCGTVLKGLLGKTLMSDPNVVAAGGRGCCGCNWKKCPCDFIQI